MPDSAPAFTRPSRRWMLILLISLLLCAGLAAAWFLQRSATDRATAAALAEALTAPRFIADGRTIEARYDLAVEDLAAAQGVSAPAVRSALERFASGGWFATKRTGHDAFLAQLASRRFESAIVSVRELAELAKTRADADPPAWRLLATAGVLELSRGRAIAAEPLLASAFDLASRAQQLDTPAAASLLTALGAVQLARRQPATAEPFLRRAASITRAADPRDRERVIAHFAQSISAQGFPEEAAALR